MIKYEIQLQITSVFNCTELEPGDSLKMIKSTLHGTDNGFNFTIVEAFDSKEEAEYSLQKYNGYKVYDSLRRNYGDKQISYDYAVDYFLEANEYDDDGIWIRPLGIIGFAPLVEISDSDFWKMDIFKEWNNRTKNESERRRSLKTVSGRFENTPDYKEW